MMHSYKQIGISDTANQTYGSGGGDFDVYHYAYRKSGTDLAGSDITDQAESYAWNESDIFYMCINRMVILNGGKLVLKLKTGLGV